MAGSSSSSSLKDTRHAEVQCTPDSVRQHDCALLPRHSRTVVQGFLCSANLA